jgi:hypothetical protein
MRRPASLTLVPYRLTYGAGRGHLLVPERGHGLDNGLSERVVDKAR